MMYLFLYDNEGPKKKKHTLVREDFNGLADKSELPDQLSTVDVNTPDLGNIGTHLRETEWDIEYLETHSNDIPILHNKLMASQKNDTRIAWSNLETTVICDLETQMCGN